MHIVGSSLGYGGAVRAIYVSTRDEEDRREAKAREEAEEKWMRIMTEDIRASDVAALCSGLATTEAKLEKETQERLENMGRGPAAELLGRVMDKGEKIRNPDKYIATAANREEKEQNMWEAMEKPLPIRCMGGGGGKG